MSEPVLLTIPQTAHALAVSRSTVYRLIADGALEAVTIRSKRRIRRSAIKRYLDNVESAQRERAVRFR